MHVPLDQFALEAVTEGIFAEKLLLVKQVNARVKRPNCDVDRSPDARAKQVLPGEVGSKGNSNEKTIFPLRRAAASRNSSRS